MKYFILLLFIITLCFSGTKSSFAQSISPTTTTPSPTTISPTPGKPEDQSILNQMQALKTKIASRVAQLKLVEKRGIIGTVTTVSNTQIILTDLQNNTRFIDVDEITKFSAPGKDSFGVSDLSKDMTISVLGLYNKDSRRITARFVNVISLPHYLSGEIASIDRKNGQFMLAGSDNMQTKIDVESITKTYSFTQSSDLVHLGFSKLNVGDQVFVIGYPDKTTSSMIIASRIMQLPEVAKNPQISIAVPTTTAPSPSLSPTTATKLKSQVNPTNNH